ncbi:MAG TPA: restriction endonuclease subunit R [Cyanobacteria bacterium UBA8803]|nr:restriction endonuclease subunit R [Cyanobacteria bacterium UBA9273]HBL59365.1 restriction endonuclease subunit R [Cyanobacteria bacterium UBA8803]
MVTLRAREITLEEVETILGFIPRYDGNFNDFLNLEPLTDLDRQDLQQIRAEFLGYLRRGQLSEGQARLISINPMLRLAGYHRAPIELRVEEDIQHIYIEDKDTHIRGRFDLVAVNRMVKTSPTTLLWVLIVESKNVAASEFAGVAQMLTYAYSSLAQQSAVWGLVSNGATYQLFHVAKAEALTYQYMPTLSLIESDRALQLLQVLKAIRNWNPEATP